MDEVLTANSSVLFLFLFLLPGFAGVLVYGFLQEGKPIPSFDRVVMAFVLALVSGLAVEGFTLAAHFAFGTPVFGLLPMIHIANNATAQDVLFSMVNLSLAFNSVAAVLIGAAFGLLNKVDAIYRLTYKILHRLDLSKKVSDYDVWTDVFYTMQGYWVRLEFKDGRMLTGWPKFYSQSGDPRELFLADATWHKTGDGKSVSVDIEGPGVYIADFSEVQSIVILR